MTNVQSTSLGAGTRTMPLPSNSTACSNLAMSQSETCQETKVRFHVSSKHLKLASPVFLARLDRPCQEGERDHASCRSISAKEWDVGAFFTFLNIIYGRHSKVPHTLSQGDFRKLATIVDYYGCRDIVAIFPDRWL